MQNELRKSGLTVTLDFLRHLLIIVVTVYTVTLVWDWNWIVALIVAIPIYVIALNLVGFLTLPLYALTPEYKLKRKGWKAIKDGNFDELRRVNKQFEEDSNVQVVPEFTKAEADNLTLEQEEEDILDLMERTKAHVKKGGEVSEEHLAALERESERISNQLEIQKIETELADAKAKMDDYISTLKNDEQ